MNCLFCKKEGDFQNDYHIFWCSFCKYEFNAGGGSLYLEYNKIDFPNYNLSGGFNYINIFHDEIWFLTLEQDLLFKRKITKNEEKIISNNGIGFRNKIIKKWKSIKNTVMLK